MKNRVQSKYRQEEVKDNGSALKKQQITRETQVRDSLRDQKLKFQGDNMFKEVQNLATTQPGQQISSSKKVQKQLENEIAQQHEQMLQSLSKEQIMKNLVQKNRKSYNSASNLSLKSGVFDLRDQTVTMLHWIDLEQKQAEINLVNSFMGVSTTSMMFQFEKKSEVTIVVASNDDLENLAAQFVLWRDSSQEVFTQQIAQLNKSKSQKHFDNDLPVYPFQTEQLQNNSKTGLNRRQAALLSAQSVNNLPPMNLKQQDDETQQQQSNSNSCNSLESKFEHLAYKQQNGYKLAQKFSVLMHLLTTDCFLVTVKQMSDLLNKFECFTPRFFGAVEVKNKFTQLNNKTWVFKQVDEYNRKSCQVYAMDCFSFRQRESADTSQVEVFHKFERNSQNILMHPHFYGTHRVPSYMPTLMTRKMHQQIIEEYTTQQCNLERQVQKQLVKSKESYVLKDPAPRYTVCHICCIDYMQDEPKENHQSIEELYFKHIKSDKHRIQVNQQNQQWFQLDKIFEELNEIETRQRQEKKLKLTRNEQQTSVCSDNLIEETSANKMLTAFGHRQQFFNNLSTAATDKLQQANVVAGQKPVKHTLAKMPINQVLVRRPPK